MENDKRDVMDWLNDMAHDNKWHCYYYDNEIQMLAKDALDLLKEQEAVVPQKHYNQKEDLIYACGKCHNDLKPNNRNAKFCWFCGKPVLWK